MIALITGTVHAVSKDSIVVLTTSGIGYEVQLTSVKAQQLRTGGAVTVHTYLRITDTSHTLYGFFDIQEKSFFELLLTVSGVGPKSAMNILGLGSIADISAAISRKDVQYLTAVQGMGKKTAERLVLELQKKVMSVSSHTDDDIDGTVMGEVIDALVAMGYQKSEAIQVVKQLDTTNKKTEVVLRDALKQLAR